MSFFYQKLPNVNDDGGDHEGVGEEIKDTGLSPKSPATLTPFTECEGARHQKCADLTEKTVEISTSIF